MMRRFKDGDFTGRDTALRVHSREKAGQAAQRRAAHGRIDAEFAAEPDFENTLLQYERDIPRYGGNNARDTFKKRDP